MSNEIDGDELIFASETEEKEPDRPKDLWKVMIVDDEDEIHKVTRLVLEDFMFDGKGVEFFSAYSGEEAGILIREHPDTALVLLDVVMETNDAGLQLTRYIREKLENRFVRIILRTGQPGHAPEREVITKYDINDYKVKTVLTDHTLFSTVVSAIRTYRDLRIIEKNRLGLEQIIQSSSSLFKIQSMKHFATGVLTQLISLLGLDNDSIYLHASGFTAEKEQDDEWNIIAATGNYLEDIDRSISNALPDDILAILQKAADKKESIFSDEYFAGYISTQQGSENLLYMRGLKRQLGELDRNLIRVFFTNVAIALDNIVLNKELVDTQKEVIVTLGEIVETRSNETANHVRRIAEYVYILGQLAGFDDNEAQLLRLAAPMHDVGKIGIPDAILNKPGKLTSEEFDVIKTHSQIGYDILKHSEREIMKTAAIIALEHHEKWNGKGYPCGLSGRQIHVNSLITAITDVFDALICKRIYKDAWSVDQIIALFKEERGQHFNAELADLFLENIDMFLKVKKRFPDTLSA